MWIQIACAVDPAVERAIRRGRWVYLMSYGRRLLRGAVRPSRRSGWAAAER
jgi:hypothetical protein